MSNRSPYDVQIAARVPGALPQLVAAAAARVFISPSAYVRQALAEKLQRDGVKLPPIDTPAQRDAA